MPPTTVDRVPGGSCLHGSKEKSDEGWLRCPYVSPAKIGRCVAPWMRLVNASWRPDSTLPCYTMAVLPHPDVVSASLCHWGAWEMSSPHDFEAQAGVVKGTLPPQGIFLDIGGNVGHFSLVFAMAGYSSIAFEPVPRNCDVIRANQCLNHKRARISLFPTALDRNTHGGPCIALSMRHNIGNAKVRCGLNTTCERECGSRQPSSSSGGGTWERCATCSSVPISTLDEALPRALDEHEPHASRRPAIVAAKLDTEGSECGILEGGSSLLSLHKPLVVLVEVSSHTRRSHALPCVRRVAAAHGYRVTHRERNDNAYLIRSDVKIREEFLLMQGGREDKTLVPLKAWAGR